MADEETNDTPKPPPPPPSEPMTVSDVREKMGYGEVEVPPAPRAHHAERRKTTEQRAAELLPPDEIAASVARGEWGEGQEAITRLRQAGYSALRVVADARRIPEEALVLED